MRIEKTMWRMLRSIVSSRNRIKRREMVRSTVEPTYIGKTYATVKSITSNPTLRTYDAVSEGVARRSTLTITSILSESVFRIAPLTKEEAQIKKVNISIKDVSSERVFFTAGDNLESAKFGKTVLNILFISSEEV